MPRRPRAPLGVALGLCLLTALSPSGLRAQRYNFRHYTNLEGLPQRQVLAIHQDDEGYVWLGTYAGITRYDGSEMRTLSAREGLEANPVQSIVGDGARGLWIGTLGGGVCHLDRLDRAPTCPGPGLAPGAGRVNALLQGPAGLWVGTDAGLELIEGNGALHSIDLGPASRRDPAVRALAEGPDRSLWIGADHGLYRRSAGGEIETISLPRDSPIAVISLLPRENGALLAGTDSGLFLVPAGPKTTPIPIELPDAVDGNVVTDLAIARDGTLWIGTRHGVVRRREGEDPRRISTRNGLLSNLIHEILVDREGNVWFGTDSGASKLVPGPFEVYGAPRELPHPFVRALAKDPSGTIWIGTRDGLAWFDEGELRQSPAGDLPSSRIYSFASVRDEAMLIGTWKGLAEWREGLVARIWRERDGLPSLYVTSLEEDGEGGAWVGTERGLARWRDGRLAPAPVDDLRATYVTTLHRHPDGDLWIGTVDRGVAVLRNDSELHWLDRHPRVASEAVWSIDHDSEGRVWIGTNGQGAFRFDGDEIERFTTAEGLVDDFVWQVLVDGTGDVWFYTNRGLDRLAPAGGWTHYGPSDGLVDLEGSATAALEGSEGDLWFGTGSGLVRYRRGFEWQPGPPPTVVLQEALDASGGQISPGARLDPADSPITARFAALTYRDEAGVRFRYRVLGVSDDWSAPVTDRRFTLSVREPGPYELQVTAARRDGLWSDEPAALPFSMRPRPWQTWPARAGIAVLALAVLAGLVSLRTRKLKRERRELEGKVEARTEELREINRRLERLASIDDLTQLANRRRFLETLETDLGRLARAPAGTGLSLFLIDLDHFKDVNDAHGHLVGDAILQQIAGRLREAVRSTDLVARYGGEEFAVILPHTDLRGARELAERVRARIAGAPFVVDGRTVPLTVSIGVLEARQPAGSREPLDVDEVLRTVDAALYRAKGLGRNRVEVGGR